jgi:NAD(P)H-flavin reductase
MKNIYKPIPVKIVKVEELSHDTKLFRMRRSDGKHFQRLNNGLCFTPGQFVLAGLWGYGEAPFGATSTPSDPTHMEIIVRRAGQVTRAMHALKKGDHMTLRGPFGNGFPLEFFRGMADLLLVTGGCGIPPIASLIRHIIENQSDFGRVHLVYGAKTPEDILLKKELKRWAKSIDILTTVDKGNKGWKGRRGLVTDCLSSIKLDPSNTAVAMCGPGPMIEAIEHIVNPMGISDRRIFISVERRMQCGVGKCQHCVCGEKYACKDGPVFNLDEYDINWD